jgi:hypothetical protein
MPGSPAYRGSPLDYLPVLRALLTHLLAWVRDGTPPPPSAHPRLDVGTLTPVAALKFPQLEGVEVPRVAYEAYRMDYGPRWSDGIIDKEPPGVGPPFPSLVPQVDEYGNERGGVPTVEILAPLATYAPWNLRTEFSDAREELTDFLGTYIPMPRTEAERRATGDPRPSIEILYGNEAAYLEAAREAAAQLAAEGWLLEEDIPAVLARAGAHWAWVMGSGS